MQTNLVDRVLTSYRLTSKQEKAALARGCDVAVTAGAGSGKTRTLVARYASLLADGCDVRKVVAITFSEKAAREMRSRARETLEKLVNQAACEEERGFWLKLNSQMDAARISTIHSLCAEILRMHPVEARVDPKFEVLDEGLAAVLRVQVVNDTMTQMVSLPEFAPLFRMMEIRELTKVLSSLMDKRLEAQELFDREDLGGQQVIHRAMENALMNPRIFDCIAELRSMGSAAIYVDAGDKLGLQVEELLSVWREIEKALSNGDVIACAGQLYQARRNHMGRTTGKKNSRVKTTIGALQAAYNDLLDPICGGDDSKSKPPDPQVEADFILAAGLVKQAFRLMIDSYKEALRQRGALDFDDLEYGAVHLLSLPEIQARWQDEIDALLVDEFQDTNERQRRIVRALTGSQGKLFVVGDAKQSIYRFRRADVTVFRSLRAEIRSQGGLPVDLDETFRTHASLLEVMSDLLQATMGTVEDPSRPYYEPFSPMVAMSEKPREGIFAPHIEFVYGAGKDAPKARPIAAQALATRLLELKAEGQIKKWDDVALLFRAATGFPAYEDAFEEAKIPFVTVAGRGFYDRPEIRDVLNILRALADPTDDLAMAGLLRSPAFGLTDATLYQLRRQSSPPAHFYAALQGDLTILERDDQSRAQRVLAILNQLIPRVDRIQVAELMKAFIDATDFRTILAAGEEGGNSGRMWRNLDKLVADAQASGIVNVRDFLEYITTINDVGAREGEAPADAQGSVRLMTIHKSKGLEFPIVVLADAARRPVAKGESVYLLNNLGLAFKLEPPPMLYNLSRLQDLAQDEVEEQRILYVALTRAQEKLIISGHVTSGKKGGWSASSWLGDLSTAAQVDLDEVIDQSGAAHIYKTPSGNPVRAWALTQGQDVAVNEELHQGRPLSEPGGLPIYAPLVKPAAALVEEDEAVEERAWRSTGSVTAIPPGVVGHMVHKAIELWLAPGDPRLGKLLDTSALAAGLASPEQRKAAVSHATELLQRFYESSLWKEIDGAAERFHEVPYSRMVGDHAETGYIDLLYRTDAGWQVLDFKTDAVRSLSHRTELVNAYTQQMRRYASVINQFLGQEAQTRMCFLDDNGKVELVRI